MHCYTQRDKVKQVGAPKVPCLTTRIGRMLNIFHGPISQNRSSIRSCR